MSKYQALIDALEAPGLTDCQWEACGPSHGAALPIYCNEVVAAPEDIDDDESGEVVCRAPLGLDDECSADMAYIAKANPATIRALLADLEMAEKALAALAQQAQEPFAYMADDVAAGVIGGQEVLLSAAIRGAPGGTFKFPLYTTPQPQPAPPVPAPVDERWAWLPIESAPKDGTAVLVMRDIWPGTKSGRAETCNGHNTYVAEWWEGENCGRGAWICYMDRLLEPRCPVDPTHWQPLPPAPQATKGGEA